MAINPMALLEMKERLDTFNRDHPKFMPFLGAVRDNALFEGSVMEVKVTTPEGREFVSNIRLNANDMETIQLLMEMR